AAAREHDQERHHERDDDRPPHDVGGDQRGERDNQVQLLDLLRCHCPRRSSPTGTWTWSALAFPVSVYLTMLPPARNANSRWRGSAETSGSMAWPSWRIAQAPAKSFEVMMIDDTPSPARAGRASGSSSVLAASASTQSWPELKRPGKSFSR